MASPWLGPFLGPRDQANQLPLPDRPEGRSPTATTSASAPEATKKHYSVGDRLVTATSGSDGGPGHLLRHLLAKLYIAYREKA